MKFLCNLFRDPLVPLCTEIIKAVDQGGDLVKPYSYHQRELMDGFLCLIMCQMEFLFFQVFWVDKVAVESLEQNKISSFRNKFQPRIVGQTVTSLTRGNGFTCVSNSALQNLAEDNLNTLGQRLKTYYEAENDNKTELQLFSHLVNCLDIHTQVKKNFETSGSAPLLNSTLNLVKKQKSQMNLKAHIDTIGKSL